MKYKGKNYVEYITFGYDYNGNVTHICWVQNSYDFLPIFPSVEFGFQTLSSMFARKESLHV